MAVWQLPIIYFPLFEESGAAATAGDQVMSVPPPKHGSAGDSPCLGGGTAAMLFSGSRRPSMAPSIRLPRAAYLTIIKQADEGDYGPLLALHQEYTPPR